MTRTLNTNAPRASTLVGAPAAARMGVRELFRSYPSLARLVSVTIFLCFWEIVGRRMDPIFMTHPTAIFEAAYGMIQSGGRVDKRDSTWRGHVIRDHLYVGGDLGAQPYVRRRVGSFILAVLHPNGR